MRKAFKEMKGFSGWLIGSIVGTFIAAMADLLLPMHFSNMINVGIKGGEQGYILQMGVLMLITIIFSAAGAIFSEYCSSKAGSGYAHLVRRNIFSKVQTFTQAEISDFGVSSLITRNTNDVTQVQTFITMFVRIIVRSPIIMIIGTIMAYKRNPTIAKPLLFAIPIIALLVFLTSRFIMPLFLSIQKRIDKVNLVLREQISGIRVIRAFVNEEHEEERFGEVNKELKNTNLKMYRIMALLMPLLMLVMNGTVLGVLWLGGGQIAVQYETLVGDILAIVQYSMQIMFALVMLSMVFVMFPRAQASARRIAEVTDKEPIVQDSPKLKVFPAQSTASVEFRDVNFTFPDAELPTLKNISFKANKGEMVAIIGSTGSGKSTILNLIMRFFNVTQGAVLINGESVNDVSQHNLREKIGYVPQKAQLFSGTIEDNLKYGNENATIEQLSEACRIAQALDFIEKEEGQFGAHVARGGTNFSGGQKQRLSIARAIVKDPDIYLFDDSFSALDAATDLKLRQALKAKTDNAVVVVVAQRISSIFEADKIVVLEDGEMVGIGKHEELLKTCEVYKEIAASQFSEEEMAI